MTRFCSATMYLCFWLVIQIVSYDLRGMPAPSLGMIMKICIAMETWLADNEDNVVVIHCLVDTVSGSYVDRQGSFNHHVYVSAGMAGMGRKLFRGTASVLRSSWRQSG